MAVLVAFLLAFFVASAFALSCSPLRSSLLMGFFSSEEDVTSMVAAKFLAGGYLAKFIADAVGDRYADMDRNGEINALELSQYLHEQYRAEVKSGTKSDVVSLNSRQLGYQHLIVDRGSIGGYDVIFK